MPTIFSNPRGPKPTQPLGASENIQNPLGTGYLIPWDGGAKIVRAPIFTGIVKVFALAALVSQAPVNLLTNTLGTPAAPAQPPFSQTDWPNPVVKKADVTNRTWIQQLTLNLLGKDQIHGAAGESKTYDYPNPQVSRRRVQDHSQNLLESTLTPAVVAQPPFFQTDWPNPTQKKPDIRGSTASINLNIFGKDKFYGAAGQPPIYDYPNPRTARRGPPDQSVNLLQSTLAPVVVAGNPFSQTEWPN